jgi:hypothetical protein
MERVRRDAAAWREIVARQESSGESAAEFCRAEKLSRYAFWRWRARLTRKGHAGLPEKRPPVSFIELGKIDPPPVRLELGAGMVLSIVRS